MASLNKLAIRGIRSFDDKELAVIEFFNPVTVIVGHNGSGKTTIIECLKYATTGDQPPNTRGGAFIHDPKMANEKEVKAQVRLRFVAANGQQMFVMRNLSVTVKKTGAMQMKTLEGVLGVSEHASNKRGTISTKCAEMDSEIPQLLGVSKAVLENVIFCHQEDSYWPLAEPGALKKKFDDIFEATKYTKALDNIKSLRKDRVADLKAEKERLSSLSLEKSHADKLKSRMSDISSNIATKEIDRDKLNERYNIVVAANAKFLETATKFREIFVKVEALGEKKSRYQEELDNARENLQEIHGTDEELADRLQNYNDHIAEQKRKRVKFDSQRQALEEEISAQRSAHMKKVSEHGQLAAEAKAHEEVLLEREETIRELSAKQHIMGYDHSPLEREKIIEFITLITDLQRTQNNETDALQSDQKSKSEAYNTKLRQLHTDVERFKQQQDTLRERQSTLQNNVSKAEREVDAADALTSKRKNIETEIEEKERRIQLVKDEIKAANFEERLGEKAVKARALEAKVIELNGEIQSLNTQGSTRTRLDISRGNLTKTENEMKTSIEINNADFRTLVGSNARPETMERELDRVAQEKQRELADCEDLAERASRGLQALEAALSETKNQLRQKTEDILSLDVQIKRGMEEAASGAAASPNQAIEEAETEVRLRNEDIGRYSGASTLYREFLETGKAKKRCPLCARNMNAEVMEIFDKNVQEGITKSSTKALANAKEELKDWETELATLRALGKLASRRDELSTTEVPALQVQLQEKETELPEATKKANETSKRVASLKLEISKISSLQEVARSVSRQYASIQQLKIDISNLEASLVSTGSTKTVEEVQGEVDEIRSQQKNLERERQTLMAEKDRLHTNLRGFENDLHAMQLNLSEVKAQLLHKSQVEARIGEMKQELTQINATLRDLSIKIAEADTPIQRLKQEHAQVDREFTGKIAKAQRASQELNMSVDRLEGLNKTIERYVRGKRARLLSECATRIEELDNEIADLNVKLDETRVEISNIDKVISESGAFVGNLRENMRVRKLIKDIAATQAEIATYDLDEAAKAKRIFDEKYSVEKQKETDLHAECAHIDGELSSLRVQLQTLEVDFKEFKDVTKRYRDQLIKVKLSDMANNDLEKYAKALDNAIMKYHTLKMEEVNDTMRHLWNKTYQGTDIDGIKISSDSEGGATKRSYNYRVVMTKDNVDMDMRGRCSAGQKMLASIIIRLALADSFGQNCGILALDEPTNALDVDNIDALAASLVDIINERKGHNFQLIIITHDENFLRKLGQSEVMEYYWRVSRDSRQKSIIERHRFD